MEQQKTIPCIYCGQVAKLVETTMIMKKGLVKIETPANNYECTVCKREFHTNAQATQTAAGIHPHKDKMNREPDRGGHSATTRIFVPLPKEDKK